MRDQNHPLYGLYQCLGGLFALAIIAAAIFDSSAIGQTIAEKPTFQKQDSQAIGQAETLSQAFRQASKTVLPSVVKIRTTTRPRQVQSNGQTPQGEYPFQGTPFEDFFSDRMGQMLQQRIIPRQDGVGSGVIIDASGIVLTNNHVVAYADEVTVELTDGRSFEASKITTDPHSDLAVIQLKGTGTLPVATLGDSSQLQVGDWVLAIGSPFELDQTVSAGIVSAKGRSLSQIDRVRFLQTDAAINPGNSGGPLVNLRGEVVGINTAIASRNGAYQGIGFAIPVNVAKWVSDQLVSTGHVDRSFLGVGIQPLTADLAENLGADKDTHGVVIANVRPNTPAAKAGMQPGDIVTTFAGEPTAEPDKLQSVVEHASTDKKQKVVVLRNGKEMIFTVQLASLPDDLSTNRSSSSRQSTEKVTELGIEVSEIPATIAQQLGYGDDIKGVLITNVQRDSVAFESGLRPGMIVQRVGKQNVSNVNDFNDALDEQSLDKGILLLVQTPNGSRFVILKN